MRFYFKSNLFNKRTNLKKIKMLKEHRIAANADWKYLYTEKKVNSVNG